MVERDRVIMQVEAAAAERRREAEALARRLGLRIVDETEGDGTGDDDKPALVLAMRDNGLELRSVSPRMRPGTGLRIDFAWLGKRGRRGTNLSHRQPLAKAIGRDSKRVLDATAGLGQDAALLAAIGFEVTAVERHPILAAMLEAARRDAMDDPAVAKLLNGRLRFEHIDARDLLGREARRFDCVYLDPMFPPKRKASALASKEIRLVRALVGDDNDAVQLLALARKHAPRVVVKRPTHAPPLADAVNTSFAGKLVRYDLYVQQMP